LEGLFCVKLLLPQKGGGKDADYSSIKSFGGSSEINYCVIRLTNNQNKEIVMFTAKVGEKSKNLIFKVAVAIFAFLLVAILGPGLLNLDSSQALAKSKGGCNQIAKAAKKACNAEVLDDYWIANGNCKNLPDPDERADCINKAKAERKDAKEECADQFDARKDLCEALGEKYYNPVIDPADFVLPEDITSVNANPYFPLVPGNMWTYKTSEGGAVTETITVEVLAGESITIEGVECVVVRDIVYEGDKIDPDPDADADDIIEDTYDWYGQQDDGTVWYFGEFSLAKEDCEPDDDLCEGLYTEDGSWKSGYEGGKAGIIMFGTPSAEVGTVFRQEIALGDAEDAGEVLSATASETVLAASCDGDCVQTRDFSPLEPDVEENKYYAPGVGVILEVGFEDGIATDERVELVEFSTP
jgi:hypothetical protein